MLYSCLLRSFKDVFNLFQGIRKKLGYLDICKNVFLDITKKPRRAIILIAVFVQTNFSRKTIDKKNNGKHWFFGKVSD